MPRPPAWEIEERIHCSGSGMTLGDYTLHAARGSGTRIPRVRWIPRAGSPRGRREDGIGITRVEGMDGGAMRACDPEGRDVAAAAHLGHPRKGKELERNGVRGCEDDGTRRRRGTPRAREKIPPRAEEWG